MRERKLEYMAWLVFEVSKNWPEADADISETIDFCEFYAREALRLRESRSSRAIARRTRHPHLHSARSRSRDSTVEFRLRDHGRHDASLDRQRNTIVLKPSSDSPTIAASSSNCSKNAACPKAS